MPIKPVAPVTEGSRRRPPAGSNGLLPVGFRVLVPYYRVWRTGRALAALLLMAAAAAAWSTPVEGQT